VTRIKGSHAMLWGLCVVGGGGRGLEEVWWGAHVRKSGSSGQSRQILGANGEARCKWSTGRKSLMNWGRIGSVLCAVQIRSHSTQKRDWGGGDEFRGETERLEGVLREIRLYFKLTRVSLEKGEGLMSKTDQKT